MLDIRDYNPIRCDMVKYGHRFLTMPFSSINFRLLTHCVLPDTRNNYMSVPWSAVIGRSGTEYSKLSREQTRTFFRGYRAAAQGVRTRLVK